LKYTLIFVSQAWVLGTPPIRFLPPRNLGGAEVGQKLLL
jgi:hypothetical protein